MNKKWTSVDDSVECAVRGQGGYKRKRSPTVYATVLVLSPSTSLVYTCIAYLFTVVETMRNN